MNKPLLTALLAAAAFTSSASAAVLYRIVDLGAPHDTVSEGIGINESGEVVGFYLVDGVGQNAYLYSNETFAPLGTLGGARSVATAINNNGQIVGGASVAGDASYHAFLYESGAMQDLGTLGGANSEAWSINDNGQIAGWSNTSSSGLTSFLSQDGVMTDLGAFGGDGSEARGINDTGMITGWWDQGSYPNATQHAFLSNGQTATDLGTLGTYQRNEAWAINDLGMVVGSSSTAATGIFHAFWFDGTTMISLGALDQDQNSEAYSINNKGQVVGWSGVASENALHAFLFQDGVLTDLNDLVATNSGWLLTQARDINDRGWIAATGSYLGGTSRAVLLVPVPEPATLALLASGLAGLGLLRQRRTTRRGRTAEQVV